MASEELAQRYPKLRGGKVGAFEVFECQLTTLNQFAEHGLLPALDFGPYKTQKADALVIRRAPALEALVIGEHKKPGHLTPGNWKAIADDLRVTKCLPTGAILGYVTDGTKTYWINGRAATVVEVVREDGHPMPDQIDYKDKKFAAELGYIVGYFDATTSRVRERARANPHHLAREVWQTIWRLKADRPEDCLATFVELFLFKFLNDLGLLRQDQHGSDVSLEYVMGLDKGLSYKYYERTIRPHIKTLFPAGPDGYSIINGIVLQGSNRDHNLIFNEILRKFIRFGSLKNTEPEFKTRLYESFLQESRTTTTFGQFFTPRKVVAAIHDMAGVENLPGGQSICDPAAGVGGFVLEQMARDLQAQWQAKGNTLTPTHKWHALEIVPKTAILAKANALVYCGEMLADQPARIKSFAKWLNSVFVCKDTTSLGALEDMPKERYDLILSNPPYVVSGSADIGKLIQSDNKRRLYFSKKYSGVEGLFIQWIVKALKRNGDAWVLLPETFFLRTTDRELREWIFETCSIDLLALLPERTFFSTPKRVVVCHLKRRPKDLPREAVRERLARERVLLYAVGETGETRDSKRLPCRSDLPALTQAFKNHVAGNQPTDPRAVVVFASDLAGQPSINLRHGWDKPTARDLGLLGAEEDPRAASRQMEGRMQTLGQVVEAWRARNQQQVRPPEPAEWRSVLLGDLTLFRLRIGRRVLKEEVYKKTTGVHLYSANVRKPFGFVDVANAGDLKYGGCLWSIDSDFDCRGVPAGEVYSITDHCGEVEVLDAAIDPHYLARQIRQAGLDQGFNRDYRPSLALMRSLEVQLPVKNGEFDTASMVRWTEFWDGMEQQEEELRTLLSPSVAPG